ncbi:MAG: hypothetical protein ACRCZJ_01550 [Erysipelotrichaceae bacterium]
MKQKISLYPLLSEKQKRYLDMLMSEKKTIVLRFVEGHFSFEDDRLLLEIASLGIALAVRYNVNEADRLICSQIQSIQVQQVKPGRYLMFGEVPTTEKMASPILQQQLQKLAKQREERWERKVALEPKN